MSSATLACAGCATELGDELSGTVVKSHDLGVAEQSPSTAFRGAGVFVWFARNFRPADHAERLRGLGFTWVALQVHDGLEPMGITDNDAELAAGWADGFRSAGIRVGAWGVQRLEPEAEAALVAELVGRYGFDFYIANAEAEYKYTAPDGSWDPTAYERSGRFVRAYRSVLPSLPSAVSSYGRADTADIDWAAWRDHGFDWLPQAYLNERDSVDPALCAEGAVAAGWPRERVHPTIGMYEAARTVTAAEYVDRLRASATVGFSIYLGESVPPDQWAGFGGATGEAPAGTGGGPGGTSCSDRCVRGGKRCVDGDGYQDCGDFNGDGCSEWSSTHSCGRSWPGTSCRDGWCEYAEGPSDGSASPSCSSACTGGSKQCLDGDRYQDCGDFNGDGCTEWSTPYSCGGSWPGTVCRAGWCEHPPAEGCSNACTPGSKQCVDGDLYRDCGDFDGDGCTEWGPALSCGRAYPGTTCRAGWCVGS